MRAIITLALLLTAAPAVAQKPIPTPAALVYLGTAIGPTRGALGDVQLGNGLAIRDTGGGLKLYVGSYNPTQVIEADVPVSFSGRLLNAHAVGSLPCQYQKIWGLAWDEPGQALYQTCHNDYDGSALIDATLSRGHFVNGTLVSDGQWAFANRSDKMTEGGVLTLPAWFIAQHTSLAGLRLASCCGGYKSVVATGPASMGFAASAFAPPAMKGAIPTVPLVGYPFMNQGPLVHPAGGWAERMHRSPDYVNDFGGDATYPRVPTAIGYTTWADWCQQCMTVIDTPGLSGVVGIWQRGVGRLWYTNTINATGWRYDLVVYRLEDLGAVAEGASQSSIQPAVDVPFPMPGVAQPDAGGHDNPPHVITGIAFEPNTRTLVIGVKGAIGSDAASMATAYLFYRVVDPLKPFTVLRTRETTETLTVQAASEDDAVARAKQAPDASWQPTEDATSYTVPRE